MEAPQLDGAQGEIRRVRSSPDLAFSWRILKEQIMWKYRASLGIKGAYGSMRARHMEGMRTKDMAGLRLNPIISANYTEVATGLK